MLNSFEQMDKWDYVTAISSGVLCGTLDNIFVKEYTLDEAGAWKAELTGIFTKQIMSKKLNLEKIGLGSIDISKFDFKQLGISQKDIEKYGLNRLGIDIRDIGELSAEERYSRNSVKKSIKIYKNKFAEIDNYFNNKRIEQYQDCIEYVTRIPGIKGLAYVLTNYFTDSEFILADEIPEEDELNKFLQERLFNCVFIWGMGVLKAKAQDVSEAGDIPEPLFALFNYLFQLPQIQELINSSDSVMMANAVDWFVTKKEQFFEGINNVKADADRFKNALSSKNVTSEFPILLNEAIVRGIYSIRRFFMEASRCEIASFEDLRKLELTNFLPIRKPILMRMITFSSGTFTAMDLSGAAIKAAIKNGGINENFVADTLTNINFVGVIRFGMTLGQDISYEKELSNGDDVLLEQDQTAMMDAQEHILSIIQNGNLPEAQQFFNGVKNATLLTAGKMNPAVATFGLYKDLERAIEEYYKALDRRIQTEIKTKEAIAVIQQYRRDMRVGVEQYMSEHLEVFYDNFDKMNRALDNNDVDLFLEKNAEIQHYLGHSVQFTTMEEFDSLMESDIDFVL